MVNIATEKKEKRINYRKRKRLLFYTCLIAIPVIQFCIFYIYVNFNSFVLAFQEYAFKEGELGFDIKFAGMRNFKAAFDILKESGYRIVFSLEVFFWCTIIGLTLALIFSYYISKKYPMSELFRVILFMPRVLSSVVFAKLFEGMVNDVYRTIMELMMGAENVANGDPILGLLENSETKRAMVIFFNVWTGFGVNVLMFSGAMSGINDSVIESAQLDGVNVVQEFLYITVPMIWPTFVSFFVVGLTGIFSNQASLHTLFGSGEMEISTIGYMLYVETVEASLVSDGANQTYSVLSAFGLVLTFIVAPLTLGLRWIFNKLGPSTD